jgi:hypothetical protein
MAANVDDHLIEMASVAKRDAHMLECAAKVFQDVGDAHTAISKSGLMVKGLTITERVESLIEIAKAPTSPDEVLEALKLAVHLYETYGLVAAQSGCGRWVCAARDAIAKAEGR